MCTFSLPRRSRTWLTVPAALLPLLCCSGSPTAPTGPTPTIVILSPVDILRIGEAVDMTLQLTFNDGRTTLVTPLWGTDRPDIVNVKPLSASRQGATSEDGKTGVVDHMLFARVTGLAIGNAWITATTEYGSCRRAIEVVD